MSVIVAALPIIGAVVSAVGAIQSGKAASNAGNFNAQVAEQNAQYTKQETARALQQQDRENYLRLGSIKANQGKSGGGFAGSVLDVLGDAAAQGELEKQNIQLAGAMKVRDYTNTANLDRAEATNARRGSYLQAGAALIGGASTMYTNGLLKRSGSSTPSAGGNYSFQG